tara:strand:+ start:518 stop:652 length:135 start_codon:yes stop_codon:yes gene_type:complete
MEIIVVVFAVFGIGFWLGIAIQRIAFKDNSKKDTSNQQKIKERK